jgi:hypothetical protein
MLVDFIGDPLDKSLFPSPVVGSPNDNVPTSGDVHLYADPKTHDKKRPILYADCEGFEGGENVPRSARLREDEAITGPAHNVELAGHTKAGHRFRKIASKRNKITWYTAERRKREFAVTHLYPRLLYTFSDVVVFVLRNSRTFESTVLHKLLDWAMKSLEKSLNQFVLPHAIIVLNAIDASIDEKQWDIAEATRTLFADVGRVLNRDGSFDEYKQFWGTRGKKIDSIKDLLESFYSSVTVIRVPARPAYMLIKKQLLELHYQIMKNCRAAYESRMAIRMLSNADDLQAYLQCAFAHFSRQLDAPFNFIEVSLRNNPIPLDFGGNILKLAITMKGRTGENTASSIFKRLSSIVASCVLLDISRHRLQGIRPLSPQLHSKEC